jgi:sulfide:quinone oxidoreductase
MPRIVIAGGGIAGLEALVALRKHLGPGAQIDLLEANPQLVQRQRAVAEPFGVVAPPRFDLARIADDHDAHLRPDRRASVDVGEHRLRTLAGDMLDYDALLIAVGARPDVAVPGALTFSGPRDVGAYKELLEDIDAGRVSGVGFALSTAVTWPLPLYELALMTADHLRTTGRRDVGLVVVTAEHAPLEAFGARIASHIWSLMAEHRIAVRTDTAPLRAGPGGLLVAHGDTVQVDRIVSLPRLGGPWIEGLPADEAGFLPTDAYGAVEGVDAIWAAGDGTSFPIKQGGLAAQQAGAAATAIAAAHGADVAPQPFRPVLRGLLLNPGGARYLEDTRGDMPEAPLWWPPTKVAAPHLGRYLHRTAGEAEPSQADVMDVGALLLALADHHATAGEDALAARCRNAAEQIGGRTETRNGIAGFPQARGETHPDGRTSSRP